MYHILTVIGARPQIIKAAAISRAVKNGYSHLLTEHILHTGQHYDANMSQVFFEQLDIPRPEYNLGVGSGTHGAQTAKMIAGIEDILLSHSYDGIILYGDTNSTLAGAIAASKIHIPVFHIEAGLRSFNMAMPEEVNRIVCDQLSSLLFAPTQTAVDNLRREGFFDTDNSLHRQVLNCGDVMYDNSLHFAAVAQRDADVSARIATLVNSCGGAPILATIHRPSNTDDPQRLQRILQALVDIAEGSHTPILLPLHPRTRARLTSTQLSILNTPLIKILDPQPFLEMTLMEQQASLILTDSGGVQKEAFFFEKPCIILRPETEWVEIVDHHAGIIADADPDRIVEAYRQLTCRSIHFPPLFGDGHAAEKMLGEIIRFLDRRTA